MVVQVIAILLLMLGNHFWLFLLLGQLALWLVLVTALVSAADYYRRYNRVLSDPKGSELESAGRRASTTKRASVS